MSLKRNELGRILVIDEEPPAAGLQLAVGQRWDDPATSDPLDDFRRAVGFDGPTIERPASKLAALQQSLLLDLDANVAAGLGRAPARDKLT